MRTKYQQNESMIIPLVRWLQAKGVNFVLSTTVNDLNIRNDADHTFAVTAIHPTTNGEDKTIVLDEGDLVFVTNSSMTQNTTSGSMNEVPNTMLYILSLQACRLSGFEPKVAITDVDREYLIGLVSKGMGVSLMLKQILSHFS